MAKKTFPSAAITIVMFLPPVVLAGMIACVFFYPAAVTLGERVSLWAVWALPLVLFIVLTALGKERLRTDHWAFAAALFLGAFAAGSLYYASALVDFSPSFILNGPSPAPLLADLFWICWLSFRTAAGKPRTKDKRAAAVLALLAAAFFVPVAIFLDYRNPGVWYGLACSLLALGILLRGAFAVKGTNLRLLSPLYYCALHYLLFFAAETPLGRFFPRAAANACFFSAMILFLAAFLSTKELE
jgi:hypothetical protein